MKIKKINIRNFKSIQDIGIADPAVFTVFIGPNGAGKTNIFEALEFVATAEQMSLTTTDQLFGGSKSYLNHNTKEVFKFELDYFNNENELVDIRFVMPLINSRGQIYPSSLIDDDIKSRGDISWIVRYLDEQVADLKGRLEKLTLDDPQNDVKTEIEEIQANLDVVKAATDNPAVKEILAGHKSQVAQFYKNFSHVFIGQTNKVKLNIDGDARLRADGGNLELVLKRLLGQEIIQEEMLEWLSLFIPEFKDVKIHTDDISGTDVLLLYMKGYEKPFGKHLISDGTYNILCLLTAVYQSDKPQFLCIEEPENGLNPYVIRQLVSFFRQQCLEKGHHIWLNTHSQTLVSQLKAEEVVLVDKKEGTTVVKQLREEDLHGLALDEAWLTNALGGGLPW